MTSVTIRLHDHICTNAVSILRVSQMNYPLTSCRAGSNPAREFRLTTSGGSRVPRASFYQLEGERVKRYVWSLQYCQRKEVSDLGCGYGYGTDFLARNGAARVIGVDNDSKAVEFAQSNYQSSNLQFAKADLANKSGYSNLGKFDACVSFEVLEHLIDPDTFLAGVASLLKPDGVMLLSTPNKLYTEQFYISGKSTNIYHFKEYYPCELERLLSCHFDAFEFFVEYNQVKYEGMQRRAHQYQSLGILRRLIQYAPDGLKNLVLRFEGLPVVEDFAGKWEEFEITRVQSYKEVTKIFPVQIAVCRGPKIKLL